MAADESSGCKDIDVGAQPFDLAFHPTNPLVAVGLITGRLHLYVAWLRVYLSAVIAEAILFDLGHMGRD